MGREEPAALSLAERVGVVPGILKAADGSGKQRTESPNRATQKSLVH